MDPYSNQSKLFAKDQMPSGLSWHLFTLFLIIFTVAVFGYLGLEFGYKGFLKSAIGELDARIETYSSDREAEGQENLVDFYSRIANLKSIVQEHPVASRIFSFLENATNVKVAYTSISLSLDQKDITLDGTAESRGILASQLFAYESYAGVSEIQLQSDSQFGNSVKFKVKITFDPKFFLTQ